VNSRPSVATLVETPGALLSRTHLRELGLERRAVDAVFRQLPIVAIPGYSRPMIRAADYQALLERCTYADHRVRPT
jgi:hypothetical protein